MSDNHIQLIKQVLNIAIKENLESFIVYLSKNTELSLKELNNHITNFNKEGPVSIKKSDETGKCQYVFNKGKNINKKCEKKTKDGSEFCSKHINKNKQTSPEFLIIEDEDKEDYDIEWNDDMDEDEEY